MQTCPTTYRRDDTLPSPPFPKTPRQTAVLAIQSYFHFFVFSLKFFGGTCPRPPRLVRLCWTSVYSDRQLRRHVSHASDGRCASPAAARLCCCYRARCSWDSHGRTDKQAHVHRFNTAYRIHSRRIIKTTVHIPRRRMPTRRHFSYRQLLQCVRVATSTAHLPEYLHWNLSPSPA